MSSIDKQALRKAAEGNVKYAHMFINPRDVLMLLDEIAELEQGRCGTALLEREETHSKTVGRLLDELEAAERRIAGLEIQLDASGAWINQLNLQLGYC